MAMFGQDTPIKPGVPSSDIVMMRINTLAEELGELAMASGVELHLTAHPSFTKPIIAASIEGDVDMVEVADALSDLQYFVDGTASAYGLDLEPFFNEVHRSNMEKFWTQSELTYMDREWNAKLATIPEGMTVTPYTRAYIVKRPDGKIMKPPGFNPPRLEPILAAQAMTSGVDKSV